MVILSLNLVSLLWCFVFFIDNMKVFMLCFVVVLFKVCIAIISGTMGHEKNRDLT